MTSPHRPALAALALAALSLTLSACAGTEAPAQARLAGLSSSVGTLNPAFDPEVTGYSLVVPVGVASVTLTPAAAATSGLSITVAQDGGAAAAVLPGASSPALAVPARGGRSLVAVTVTGVWTVARTYTVALFRADDANARLASLTASAGSLSPAFAGTTTAYALNVPSGTASFTLTPTAAAPAVQSIQVTPEGGTTTTVANGAASGPLPVPALGGQSTVAVKVTAQNGYTTQTYTVTVVQVPSSDATLASLAPSAGSLSPAFGSATTTYALVVPNGTASLTLTPRATSASVRSITLSRDGGAGVAVASGAASAAQPVPAVGAQSVLALTVVAQDATTTVVYRVTLTQAASTDAALSALALSAGSLTPAFASAITTYAAVLPHGTASITLTPTARHAGAKSITVSKDGGAATAVASGAASPALAAPAVGAQSVVTVAVTAQDDSTVVSYRLTLTQAASTDAGLSALQLSAGALTPAFASATRDYTATVPFGTSSITLTATARDADVLSLALAQDGGASRGLASGTASPPLAVPAPGTPTNLALVVTAQDGVTTATYRIRVSQAATNDASLASLAVSAGSLSPDFASATTAYSLAVPYGTTQLRVTPTATSPDISALTVAQGGGAAQPVASGSPSQVLTIPAVGSSSTVTVQVTAQDGITVRAYTLALTQTAPSTDAALASLAASAGALSPAFASGTTAYSLQVPWGTATVTLTPAARSALTQAITVAQDAGAPATVASGSASAALAVPALGTSSTVSVEVTAQDGTTKTTYAVTLTQGYRNDSALSALADSAGGLTGFAPATFAYSFTIPAQINGFSVTATTHDSLATLKVNGAAATSGVPFPLALALGANTINVLVTSADGTATSTYVLTVTMSSLPPGLVNARTVPVTAAPLLTVTSGALLPANASTGAPVDTLLRIGFDGPPTLGTSGSVRIYAYDTDTLVDTIKLDDVYAVYDGGPKKLVSATSTKVDVIGGLSTGIDQVRVVNYVPFLISGNTVVIAPHNNKLAYNTHYYVTIDSGVLQGAMGGFAYGGFTNKTLWSFTTKAAPPAGLSVAADNSADFATVQGAIDAVPYNNSTSTVIAIAPGAYQELLFIRKKNNLTLRGGNNGLGTVIQYDNCDGFNPGTGGGQTVTTPGASGSIPATQVAGGGRGVLLVSSATGLVLDGVTLMNLHGQNSQVVPTLPTPSTVPISTLQTTPTFTNYSSGVTQAETIYFNTSFAVTGGVPSAGTLVAKHSNFVSYQDTIQVKGFSWFYDCFITGDVDFIWGSANTALFEQSEIRSRNNASNVASIVQSRAFLTWDASNATTPSSTTTSYPGFVFLKSALTKEPGTFTAYLARSPGNATTSGTNPILYTQYDLVSYIGCTMDSHIDPAGWNSAGSSPAGANLAPTSVTGWREYKSLTPTGQPLSVSGRVAGSSPPNGSIQLSDAAFNAFFKDRATIFTGATDGTYTTRGAGGFSPVP